MAWTSRGCGFTAPPLEHASMTTTLSRPLRDASWSERAAIFAIFMTLGLCTGAWAAALPALKAGLALSDRDLGLALFGLAAGSIGATLVTGAVAARLGTRRTTTVGAVAVVAALVLPPLAGSLAMFSAAALAFGLAAGVLDVSMNGHAGALEERWGSPVMSSFHGAFSLGGLGGAAFGGALAAAGWGSAGQLWMPVALAGICNLLALPFLGRGAEARPGGAGPAVRLALPSRGLLGLAAVAAFCFAIEGAMGDWSAVFLTTVAGSSVAVAATGYAAFSIAMAAVRFAGDRAVALFGARRILFGGGSLAGAGLAMAVLVPAPAVAAIGFALVGLGLGNVAPVAFSAAARSGSTPAAGIAPVATVGYAGFMLGPPVIGFLSTLAGLRIALGCLVLLAGGVALVGSRVGQSQPEPGGRRSLT